ncbi:hypothetical protein ACLOJK_015096 [Asimina triloba]
MDVAIGCSSQLKEELVSCGALLMEAMGCSNGAVWASTCDDVVCSGRICCLLPHSGRRRWETELGRQSSTATADAARFLMAAFFVVVDDVPLLLLTRMARMGASDSCSLAAHVCVDRP